MHASTAINTMGYLKHPVFEHDRIEEGVISQKRFTRNKCFRRVHINKRYFLLEVAHEPLASDTEVFVCQLR